LTNNIKLPDIKYSYTSIGMNQKYKITTFPHFFLIDKKGNGIEGSQVYFDKSLPNNIYDKIEDLKKM
jgi:thioredoxin-related protein